MGVRSLGFERHDDAGDAGARGLRAKGSHCMGGPFQGPCRFIAGESTVRLRIRSSITQFKSRDSETHRPDSTGMDPRGNR